MEAVRVCGAGVDAGVAVAVAAVAAAAAAGGDDVGGGASFARGGAPASCV